MNGSTPPVRDWEFPARGRHQPIFDSIFIHSRIVFLYHGISKLQFFCVKNLNLIYILSSRYNYW